MFPPNLSHFYKQHNQILNQMQSRKEVNQQTANFGDF